MEDFYEEAPKEIFNGHGTSVKFFREETGPCLPEIQERSRASRKTFVNSYFTLFKIFFSVPSRREEPQIHNPARSFLHRTKFLIVHIYYLVFILHSFLYLLEVSAHLFSTTVSRDASVKNLKFLLYNSRYGFMVIKSAVLFLSFRQHSGRITQLTTVVADEFRKLPHQHQKLLKILVITAAFFNIVFCVSWDILDFASYDLPFYDTWHQDVDVALFGLKVKHWMIQIAWYSLGTPMIIITELAIVFVNLSVVTLYLSWRSINKRLIEEPLYLMKDFHSDWDRLRCITEQADNAFSFIIFTAWMNDMACAVGYIGSIVLYGAGNPPEQAYTVLGLFIYAVWNPVCYFLPCILFDEEVTRIRQTVVGVIHDYSKDLEQRSGSEENIRSWLKVQLILQNITSYRPVAFTAWKFFYITRNVLLTMCTAFVSYAVILIQLVQTRHPEGTPQSHDGPHNYPNASQKN